MKLRQASDWIQAKPARTVAFVIAMTLLIVALIPTVITWAPHWLASTNGLNADQRASEVGRVRTALLAVIAGGIAVLGAVYTARTFGLNRQGQITERFTRAVDQLGNEKLDVRLGGIYALERLARESREDHGPIVEILTAFVREHAPQPIRAEKTLGDVHEDPATGPTRPDAEANEATPVSRSPATDVQAVLTVLGRRRTDEYETARNELDLERTDLAGANLREADLRGASLAGANLGEANLLGAKLQGAGLIDANLQAANLQAANLQGARIGGANLQRANLGNANLQGAFLWWGDLRGASLDSANLQGAFLENADLMEARLGGANLGEANLEGAKLQEAYYDRETIWPSEFEPSAHGAVRFELVDPTVSDGRDDDARAPK